MANYPQDATGLDYETHPAGPTVSADTLTAAGSANTKGSYAEFTASSGFECNQVIVRITASDASAGRLYLMDLATGAGGAETVIVPNMATDVCASLGLFGRAVFDLPLEIASSTRIAGRVQCSTAGGTITVAITLVAAGDTPGCTSFDDYGTNTGTSGLTSVDPGGSADTKGSYSEITASTSAVSQVIVPMFTIEGNTAPSSNQWAVDIATGAGGSETVLIPDLRLSLHSNGPIMDPRSFTFLTFIADTTRIAARASSVITDATDRVFYIGLLTATAPSEPSATGGMVIARRGASTHFHL